MERRRPVVVALTAVAVLLIALGVAAIAFDAGIPGGSLASASFSAAASGTSNRTAGPSSTLRSVGPSGSVAGASSSAAPSPSSLASASASANPAGFLQVGDGFAYRADDGSLELVPAVPGLQVQLQSGRAIYSAQASNHFGLLGGSYAGEFMPLVAMGQADGSSAQTGGLVLAGPVIGRMISDRIAAAQSDTDRWVVALPVDIRSTAGTEVEVSFDRYGLAGWSNTPRVQVRFQGTLPVVEAVPSNTGFHVLAEELGVARWQVIDPLRLSLATDSIDPAHSMNELLVYGNGAPNVATDQFFDARAAVGSVMLSASGDVSVSLVVAGSHADLGPSDVLTVGDVPVFVAAI